MGRITTEMLIYSGLQAGLDYDTAMAIPVTELEDIIATHQIMTKGYTRIYRDPKDQEEDFLKTMSAR